MAQSLGFFDTGRIRATREQPEIAVIMFTNLPDSEVRYIAEQNGAGACLFKQDLSGGELDRAIPVAAIRGTHIEGSYQSDH